MTFCFFHVDDVLGHDASESDHLEHLKLIFQMIREAGLKLNLSKCAFFKRLLQHLGHLISGEGIYPLKERLETILNLKPPQRHNQKKTYNRTSLLLQQNHCKVVVIYSSPLLS